MTVKVKVKTAKGTQVDVAIKSGDGWMAVWYALSKWLGL